MKTIITLYVISALINLSIHILPVRNSLPTSITALTSLPSFKRQLKTFLFTKSLIPISLIFHPVIYVPCPKAIVFSLCHVNLLLLLLLLLNCIYGE